MDYVRYLRSKITVDDRALNMSVLQSFEQHVTQTVKAESLECLRIVEVGAGVGAMFTRLYERKTIFQCCNSVEYVMIDIKEEVLNATAEQIMQLVESETKSPTNIPEAEKALESTVRDASVHESNSIHHSASASATNSKARKMTLPNATTVQLVLDDALRYLSKARNQFDVVIGAAVLDLWEADEVVPVLKECLDPARRVRAFYFPITFDGVTDFFPPSSAGADFDREVEDVFHRSMGSRTTLGESTLACHSGRRLIPTLQRHGACLKSVGSSAWAVYPDQDGAYKADEKFFLNCIISFIEQTVLLYESSDVRLASRGDLKRYSESRRQQLMDGRLYYLAHNVDVFCVI